MIKRRFSYVENLGVVITPEFFKRNTDIVILDLSYSPVTEISSEILNLTNLEELNISNTSISSLPIEIGSLKNLTLIRAANTPMSVNPNYKNIDFSDPKKIADFFKNAMKQRPALPPFSYNNFIELKSIEEIQSTFTVFSWNILSNHAAKPEFYPFSQKKFMESKYREDLIAKKTLALKPDIICFQEFEYRLCHGTNKQYIDQFIKQGYDCSFVPKGRFLEYKNEEDKNTVHGQITFFNKAKFELVDSYSIELRKSQFQSSTIPASALGSDDVLLLTLLKHKITEKYLLIANVHLIYSSSTARQHFVSVIMDEIGFFLSDMELDDADFIIAGDFNDTYQSNSIQEFITKYDMRSAYDLLNYNPVTYPSDNQRIDHLLLSKRIQPVSLLVGMTSEELDQKCPFVPSQWHPSDHFPVAAVFLFSK